MNKDHNRYRNTSITFRLTADERDAVHFRSRVLGLPLQEMFLKTFLNQPIEVTMGMFDSERVAIELRKLRKEIDTLPADDQQIRDEIRKCRICLEQILEVFRI